MMRERGAMMREISRGRRERRNNTREMIEWASDDRDREIMRSRERKKERKREREKERYSSTAKTRTSGREY